MPFVAEGARESSDTSVGDGASVATFVEGGMEGRGTSSNGIELARTDDPSFERQLLPRDADAWMVSISTDADASTDEERFTSSDTLDTYEGSMESEDSDSYEQESSSTEGVDEGMFFSGAEFEEDERDLGRDDLYLSLFSYRGHNGMFQSMQSNCIPVYLEGDEEKPNPLPFLSFEDVAIFPGTRFCLPHGDAVHRKIVQPALAAKPPAKDRIAIVFYFFGGLRRVGAIVKICHPSGNLETEPVEVCCEWNFDASTGKLLKIVGGALSSSKQAELSSLWRCCTSSLHMPNWLLRHNLWVLALHVLFVARRKGLYTIEPPANANPHAIACWIASSGPFDYQHQKLILDLDTTYERLCAAKILLESSSLFFQCSCCDRSVAAHSDMTQLSSTGLRLLPGTIFANTHNIVHDVILVKNMVEDASRMDGNAVEEHSWFSGYAWTIMRCSCCTTHWGWKFTQTVAGEGLPVFWALSRRTIWYSGSISHERDNVALSSLVP